MMTDIVEDSQDSDAALFDNFDYSALNAELALLEQVPYTSKRDQADRLLAEVRTIMIYVVLNVIYIS